MMKESELSEISYRNTVITGECDIESETQPHIVGNVCNTIAADDIFSCVILYSLAEPHPLSLRACG